MKYGITPQTLAKWVLSFDMIAGRLEFYTLLVTLTPWLLAQMTAAGTIQSMLGWLGGGGCTISCPTETSEAKR